jgi:hypothetical protein
VLSLVSVGANDGRNLQALQLGMLKARPSIVTLIQSTSYKQGVNHLVFIGYACGNHTLSSIIPSNPLAKRMTDLCTHLNVAPIRSMAKYGGDQLLLSYGRDRSSGLAALGKCITFGKMVQWNQVVSDVWSLPNDSVAVWCENRVRLLCLEGDAELRELELGWDTEQQKVLLVALVEGVHVCVTATSLRTALIGKSGNALPFPHGRAHCAVASGNVIFVVSDDSVIQCFTIDSEAHITPSSR